MYVDEYRLRRGAKDHPPVCKDSDCDFLYHRIQNGQKYMPFHRVSTKGCSGYADYIAAASMADSKHSPIKPHDGDEVPF